MHVSGVVLDASGVPAGGAQVALFKEGDIGEVVIGATIAIGTLGIACFATQAPSVCGSARKGTTGPDGAFAFTLKGTDTQGTVGNADSFDLAAVLRPAAGGTPSVAALRFKIQRTTLQLPALRVWDGQLNLSESGREVRLDWPALPPAYGSPPTYTVDFVDSATNRSVWTQARATSGGHIDARLLEDRHGDAEVDASTSTPGPDTTFTFTYISSHGAFSGPGAPPSRGAPCFASAAAASASPLQPCKLTGGDLFTPAQIGAGTGVVDTAAYVDLGSSHAIGLAVVRGAGVPVTLETSSDAQSWTYLGVGSGAVVGVAPARPVTARYVRVRTTSSVSLAPLTEISVW